jgi:CRP/FNR family cyclic AMP-dependent transcriptional regulator
MVSGRILKEFSFFQIFSEAQLEKLAAIATDESYEAGNQMYKKGDPARSFFIVREGKVMLFMDNSHRPSMQITVDVITRGESMGWSALVEPYIYTLGALCIDRSAFIALDAGKLRQLSNTDPDLGYKLMQATVKVIANRLNHTRIILVGERGLSHLSSY